MPRLTSGRALIFNPGAPPPTAGEIAAWRTALAQAHAEAGGRGPLSLLWPLPLAALLGLALVLAPQAFTWLGEPAIRTASATTILGCALLSAILAGAAAALPTGPAALASRTARVAAAVGAGSLTAVAVILGLGLVGGGPTGSGVLYPQFSPVAPGACLLLALLLGEFLYGALLGGVAGREAALARRLASLEPVAPNDIASLEALLVDYPASRDYLAAVLAMDRPLLRGEARTLLVASRGRHVWRSWREAEKLRQAASRLTAAPTPPG